jgi:hypothetical protein
MGISVGWSDTVGQQFMDYIVGFLKVTPSLYRYFQSNGLIRNLGDGIDKINYLEANEIDGGRMASSIHQHNIVTPEWKEVKVSFLYLNTLIRISRQDVDKHRNGQRLRGDLIKDTMDMVIPTMVNQIDQFCAWGDRMKDSLTALDKYRNSDTFTGLFNSGTTLQGGADTDDDMTTLGDYRYTAGAMRNALRAAAHEMNQYMLLSDLQTSLIADIGANHQYTNVGISEHQRVMEKKYIKDWMDSDNFIDSSEAKYRMAMIAPKQINPSPIGGKGITNNFELLVGYPFRVMPVYGGQMDIDKYFNWAVTWSGAFVVYKDTAIQHTGDLTLT